MAEKTRIEWCDSTVNFWWGCTKVGPGCDHCYAEDLNAFRGTGMWGAGTPRLKIKGAVADIRRYNRAHAKFHAEHGRHRRVFINSMSDLFDNEVDYNWQKEAFAEIEAARDCEFILLTKRITNVARFAPFHWIDNRWPRHSGLMVTTVTQAEANRDVPRLIKLKKRGDIPWVGLSMEPLLEQVKLKPEWLRQLDWIIVGGESGRDARPMHPDWARGIREQCDAFDVPFLFKQWGTWLVGESLTDFRGTVIVNFQDGQGYPVTSDHADIVVCEAEDSTVMKRIWKQYYASGDGHLLRKLGKHTAGRMLDGRIHDAWPAAMQ